LGGRAFGWKGRGLCTGQNPPTHKGTSSCQGNMGRSNLVMDSTRNCIFKDGPKGLRFSQQILFSGTTFCPITWAKGVSGSNLLKPETLRIITHTRICQKCRPYNQSRYMVGPRDILRQTMGESSRISARKGGYGPRQGGMAQKVMPRKVGRRV